MARVSSRNTARRSVQKKSSLPSVALVLYMAGLAMYYVYLQSTNRQLHYSLEVKKKEISESRNRIRNINAEVEKLTAKRFIEAKVQQFNLGLRVPDQRIKQVYEVTHIDTNSNLPGTVEKDSRVSVKGTVSQR